MKVGLFFGSFSGGGAQRMMVNLARGLSLKGVDVRIYVVNKKGPYLKEVPENIPINDYEARFGVKSIIHKIRKTLKNDGLDSLISTQMHINSAVGIASIGLNNSPVLIFREANMPSKITKYLVIYYFFKWCYSFANHFIAVSKGVAEDLVAYFKIDSSKISVIYNPVIDDSINVKMNEVVEHSWFNNPKIPVIVGMGRFDPQKGFEDLIEAFVIVRGKIKARLVIFGETNENSAYFKKIHRRIKSSLYSDDILLPGFVDNPFKYLNKADVFVLSSKFEGLPGVLIQAMACGCPIISTDCPSGPREILCDGKYGKLVDVGDYRGMAESIIHILNKTNKRYESKKRANCFSINNSTVNYLKLIRKVGK